MKMPNGSLCQTGISGILFTYRDLPEIIFAHVNRRKAIDFGCGTGRSSRFLKKIGFEAIGVDISETCSSTRQSPEGDYRLIEEVASSTSRSRLRFGFVCLPSIIYPPWKKGNAI
jgi:SAM-dependent methyltransferase